MISMLSDNEAACLDVAIELFRRSDAYAANEPRLSRQFARQAYELGHLSPSLRESIAHERIRMIVQNSVQGRVMQALDAVDTVEWRLSGSQCARAERGSKAHP